MKMSMLSAALLIGIILPKKIAILQGSIVAILDVKPQSAIMIEK